VLAVLLFGPPGAGKGTQAAAVAAASGMPHIATGDMFREHMRLGTPLGLEARGYLDSGALVPDDVTIGMLADRISQPDAVAGFVLDGYPRNLDQAGALDRMLAERGAKVAGVLDMQVPEDDLVRRLAGRLVCRAASHPYHVTEAPPAVPGVCDIDGSELYQRADDRPETVRARMAQQLGALAEVIAHYRDLGVLLTVDGLKGIDDVSHDIGAALAAAGIAAAEADPGPHG
jgi:adenylate kinase